jgi:hypothetical protein
MGIVFCLLLLLAIFLTGPASAGPYPPPAGQQGSTAVSKDDPAFEAWATGYENYWPGADVNDTFQTPEKALGKAEGTAFDIVSLGEGGSITLTFNLPVTNGEGWDFAVFENSFLDDFLELAYVEVSSDGTHFVRFDSHSLTPSPVGAFHTIDPTDINGLAGKYRQGFGTPFDLQDLTEKIEVTSGAVNLDRITHIRIVDVKGDGSCLDSTGAVIWDPYPTKDSAGFDLDAVGLRYQASGVETAVDIKVNGSDDTVTVPQGMPVTISLAVTAGAHLNQNVDWWLVRNDSTDWLSFVATEGWVGGIKAVFQFPLFDLPLTAVFEVPDLPQGTHTFYFAIDNNADGIPDATWFDFVTVMVE